MFGDETVEFLLLFSSLHGKHQLGSNYRFFFLIHFTYTYLPGLAALQICIEFSIWPASI